MPNALLHRLVPSLTLLATMCLGPAAADPPPERLVLTKTDGTVLSYFLSTIRRIDPSPSGLVILLRDGSQNSVPLTAIRRLEIEPTGSTDVGDLGTTAALAGLRLLPGFPNPAARSVALPFELARRTRVVLDVFSVMGQRVRSLASGELGGGTHTLVWDGKDDRGRRVSGGVYFYRMRGAASSRRVTILP